MMAVSPTGVLPPSSRRFAIFTTASVGSWPVPLHQWTSTSARGVSANWSVSIRAFSMFSHFDTENSSPSPSSFVRGWIAGMKVELLVALVW